MTIVRTSQRRHCVLCLALLVAGGVACGGGSSMTGAGGTSGSAGASGSQEVPAQRAEVLIALAGRTRVRPDRP